MRVREEYANGCSVTALSEFVARAVGLGLGGYDVRVEVAIQPGTITTPGPRRITALEVEGRAPELQ